jgi:hypothetical protein
MTVRAEQSQSTSLSTNDSPVESDTRTLCFRNSPVKRTGSMTVAMIELEKLGLALFTAFTLPSKYLYCFEFCSPSGSRY